MPQCLQPEGRCLWSCIRMIMSPRHLNFCYFIDLNFTVCWKYLRHILGLRARNTFVWHYTFPSLLLKSNTLGGKYALNSYCLLTSQKKLLFRSVVFILENRWGLKQLVKKIGKFWPQKAQESESLCRTCRPKCLWGAPW